MIHVRDFPLVWTKFANVLLTNELNESLQHTTKPFAYLFISRILTASLTKPIEMETSILNLDHPVAVLVLDLQAAGRILRQLELNALGPSSRFLETLELWRQWRDILNNGPLDRVERFPKRSQMRVAKSGQAIELNPQNRLYDGRVFVVWQRTVW